MAGSRLRVDPATRARLGPGTLAELRRALRPVDCQTCGRRFSRWDAAALAVEAADQDAVASLHHRGCRSPSWRELQTPDRFTRLPHQTWRARLLWTAAHGHDDLTFLVNPSYETARLTCDGGRWRVATLDLFAHRGLGRGLLDGVSPLPSLSAVVDTDRLAVDVVSLDGTVLERWDIGGSAFPQEAARVLAGKDWLTIAVTTAIDVGEQARHNPMRLLLDTRQVRLGAAAVRYTEAAQRPRTTDFGDEDRWIRRVALTSEVVRRATGVEVDKAVIAAALASCHGDGEPITRLAPEDRTRAAAILTVPYTAHNSGGAHVMAADPSAAAAYHRLFSALSEITGTSAALLTREPATEEILTEFGADIVIGTPEQFLATHLRHRRNTGDWGPDGTRAHLALVAGADVRQRVGGLIARYPRTAIV
ncbi:hypothetical protein RM844_26160 [Streptomyces sp. DSM 44915]|uniref:Uncharacterized protein n=1 Tax=Streptomyces chisholmiae TaxID=3075540 RepID=A0ABU2JXT2_9ACTN|nr:hypothetical protein [Streptomyces sp. DSM 44915]MDT0269774.1 hypothetical protein [Streptomyces sp. DSM 44915]